MKKELRKAIALETSNLKQDAETTRALHNQQRNNNLKKSRRSYFESLDVIFVKDNKKVWKKISQQN